MICIILSDEQLSQLHQTELRLLKAFTQVCEKLDLTYYVIAGTLLGAVRHQGFIPWDDDIDIAMPRADYERFLKYGQQDLPDGVFLQTFLTDPGYPLGITKLRDSNTTFVENQFRTIPMNHGVYIDIFPMDFYEDRGNSLLQLRVRFLSARLTEAFPFAKPRLHTRLIRRLMSIRYPTIMSAQLKREQILSAKKATDQYVVRYSLYGARDIAPIHLYGKGTKLQFEGLEVNAPEHYHEILTKVYGDYMQLPPVEERISHHNICAFDLNTPYTKYIT